MHDAKSLDQLTPKGRRILGAVIMLLGVFSGAMVVLHPQQLRAPLWVVLTGCSCFVLSGAAIALYSATSRRAYRWLVVALVGALTAIPAWLAIGPWPRACSSSIPMFAGETPCRFAFGFGAILLLLMFIVAVVQAVRDQDSA